MVVQHEHDYSDDDEEHDDDDVHDDARRILVCVAQWNSNAQSVHRS